MVNQPVALADLGDGTYRNPILHADYADPDVIRVGNRFYMVSSSFSHFPGLPILESPDLISWRIIGHALQSFDLPGLDRPRHGEAVWAPSIRYHDSKFWIFFSTPDEGIYMLTAEKPEGPWTQPHMIKEVKGWIDPCPFWDEDGRAYLVHAFAHSRSGIHSKLQLLEMSSDGKRLIGEGQLIYDGTINHPVLEGPKVYKRNGYYYIFAPAGGVATGWQTILRSSKIEGPYEDKIVLHQGDSAINGPHQGGWIETESGQSWFLHFQERGAYGRIIHLQPMHWEEDWPVMGRDTNEDGIGEPVAVSVKPDMGGSIMPFAPDTSDEFDGARLGLQWQWQANSNSAWYSLEERASHLRLYARELPPGAHTLYEAPQLLLQKFPAAQFRAAAKLEFKPSSSGDITGLMIFGMRYMYLAIRQATETEIVLTLVQGKEEAGAGGRVEEKVWETEAALSSEIYLQVTVTGDAECQFGYSLNGQDYYEAGPSFAASAGRWVGAKMGIFAIGAAGKQPSGYSDFDWFRVEEIPS